MRIWRAYPTMVCQHEETKACAIWTSSEVVSFNTDWQKRFRIRSPYKALDAYASYLQVLESEGDDMKWNPKPAACFHRAGFGYILVFGKQVLQFDEKWNKTQEYDYTTHYRALQQGLLMIGAIESDIEG